MMKNQQGFLKDILENKNKLMKESIQDRIKELHEKHSLMIEDNKERGKIPYEKYEVWVDNRLMEWKTIEKKCGWWCSSTDKFHFIVRNEDGVKNEL